MNDELARSKQLAVVAGSDAPYFFSYMLTDAETRKLESDLVAARNRAAEAAAKPAGDADTP